MPSFSESIPLFAVYAGGTSFLLALLLVFTKHWHGQVTMDSCVGVQKVHQAPTPRVGGIAILVGILVGYQFFETEGQALLFPLIVAGIPAFAFGLLEDLTKQVGVRTRLLATMVCGVLGWAMTGESITSIDIPGVDWILGFTVVSVAFTAFAVGGVANAINIIDGFNGLAAGTVIIILTAFGVIATSLGDSELALTCLIVAGAVTGFALVNWPFGKLFLGDGGAYFIGFALAWLSVLLTARHPEVSPWAPVLVCGYPILEVLFSIVRRRRRNISPGAPDRLHLHSLVKRRLVRRLLPQASNLVRNSVTGAIMWGAAFLPAGVAVLWYDNAAALVTALLALAGLYSATYDRLTRFQWLVRPAARHSMSRHTSANVMVMVAQIAPVARSADASKSSTTISIITATRNSAATIDDALNSLARQTHPDVEQIWVDGASTDGTRELLEARLVPGRATLISEPDSGIYDALNKGLRRATGEVVGFLHADDMLANAQVLARVAKVFEDPSVGAVYGDLDYVRKDDTAAVVRHWAAGSFDHRKLARGWMPPHPALYLRREIYERLGGFDAGFSIAADYDHVLRTFSQASLNAVYLPEVLVKMRVGGASNRSLSNVLRKSHEDLKALRRNRVGGLGTLTWKNCSKVKQLRAGIIGKRFLEMMEVVTSDGKQVMIPAKSEPESELAQVSSGSQPNPRKS